MTLVADGAYHIIHIFLAKLFRFCLYHHPDHRLSSGLPHQDPAGVPQFLGNLCHRGLDILIRLGNRLVGDPDIF